MFPLYVKLYEDFNEGEFLTWRTDTANSGFVALHFSVLPIIVLRAHSFRITGQQATAGPGLQRLTPITVARQPPVLTGVHCSKPVMYKL